LKLLDFDKGIDELRELRTLKVLLDGETLSELVEPLFLVWLFIILHHETEALERFYSFDIAHLDFPFMRAFTYFERVLPSLSTLPELEKAFHESGGRPALHLKNFLEGVLESKLVLDIIELGLDLLVLSVHSEDLSLLRVDELLQLGNVLVLALEVELQVSTLLLELPHLLLVAVQLLFQLQVLILLLLEDQFSFLPLSLRLFAFFF